jgi:hypothetical protein
MPRDEIIKQFIATININRDKYGNVPICMHAVFKSHGGPWKSGWTFEAISIEFFERCHPPLLDRSLKTVLDSF